MILYIDTTDKDRIKIAWGEKARVLVKREIMAPKQQAEKLLPGIDKLCHGLKRKLKDIKIIKVTNQGGSFTALRIGVLTANALGYALGAPVQELPGAVKGRTRSGKVIKGRQFDIVKPVYDRKPNITKKKHK